MAIMIRPRERNPIAYLFRVSGTGAMNQTERNRLIRLTRYWRAIQVAAALEGKAEDHGEDAVHAPFTEEDFKNGKAPERFAARAFARADTRRKEGDPEITTIDVLMTPFRLAIPQRRNGLSILFAHAHMNRRGELLVKNAEAEIPPIWIGRPCFAPTDLPEMGIFPFGDAERYYQTLQMQCRDMETWPTSWSAMLQRFEDIWKDSAPDKPPFWQYITQSSKPKIINGTIWVEKHDPKMLTIVGMYDRLIDMLLEGKCPALYREIACGSHPFIRQPLYQKQHLGQMGGKYPLAPSQRIALLSYLGSIRHGITAVNGPPGTGKITLLQSVVASEMVRTAIAETKPPLFLASAATNQAVLNIIDAFKKATAELNDQLADRWIPGIGRRYGIYFRAKHRDSIEMAKGALVCVPSQLSAKEEIEEDRAPIAARNADKIANSKDNAEETPIEEILALAETEFVRSEFLAKAEGFLPGVSTIEEVAVHAHEKIVQCAAKIERYCEAATDLVSIASLTSHNSTDDFDGLEMLLQSRIAKAKIALRDLQNEHKARREEERKAELVAREDDKIQYLLFCESQDRKERDERRSDDEQLADIAANIASLNDAANRFSAVAEPTSFFGWIADALPWVRSRKLRMLSDIALELYDAGFEDCPEGDLRAARAWMRECLATRKERKEESKRIMEAARARSKEHNRRKSAFKDEIKKRAESRMAQMQERDAERRAAERQAELAIDDIEQHVKEWQNAYRIWSGAAKEISPHGALPNKISEVEGFPDTNVRVEAFLWATHYWEARFLQSARSTHWRDQSSRERCFRLIAMIAPCFVSTFDKIGSAFNRMGAKGVIHPMWDFADTLIIDEAGQASPDKGAFAFGFAEKALVVGDNFQLPPVTSEDCAAITRSSAEKLGLLNDIEVANRCALSGKFGLQRSPGSIMRMATAASWCHLGPNDNGVWLRDHFRCDDRIVAFSNEIWYTGEKSLVPRRKEVHHVGPDNAKVPRFLPPFGHVHVDGRRVDNCNVEEIFEMFDWIKYHARELQRAYRKPIEEIVAIVTPFANQKMRLRNERDSYPWGQAFKDDEIGISGNPEKIKMGTAYVLQGAERPVILFSTVCTDDGGNYYFDREHTLMNVAVTRAEDSFIVFGHELVFAKRQKHESKPSTHLRDHLFEKGYGAVPLVPREKSA